jgi:hypothetical protein
MFAEKSSVAFRPVLDMPTKLKPLPPAATLPQDSGPSQQAVQQPDSRTAFPFKGGETAALGNAETFSF